MTTKLEIINTALITLGVPPINALTGNDETEAAVVSMYDRILDDCFAQHPWKFALTTETLLESVDEPVTQRWSRVFILPPGFIQTWSCYPQSFNYIIQGNRIYTNMGPTWKWTFIKNVSPGLFPQYFSLYVSYRLAAECAMIVTQDAQLMQIWSQKATWQLGVAQNRDATQTPNVPMQFNPYWSDHYAAAGY